MLEKHNQHYPFEFKGAADDPVVYAKLRQLSAEFPGNTWRTLTPAEARLDEAKLAAFRDFLGGRGCVVRHGCVACTWGDQAQRGDVASAVKPWFAHFLAKAVAEGKIKSFDSAAVDVEPRLEGLNEKLGFKDRQITWRQLINQTSCYGVREAPGTAFDYNDYNMALLCDTLFLRLYGTTWDKVDAELLRPQLADVIGCEDQPTFVVFGAKERAGRLGASVRDMARFGLLYLQSGNWRGRQILDAKLVAEMLGSPLDGKLSRTSAEKAEMIAGQRTIGGGINQTDHFGSYSFAWWTNGVDREGKRHWPDAPLDTFAALGHGGMRGIVVIPSLDLIASWNDAVIEGREKQNRALGFLTHAVVPGP
jgi:hypothetical protein